MGRSEIVDIELETRNLEFLTERKPDFFPTFYKILFVIRNLKFLIEMKTRLFSDFLQIANGRSAIVDIELETRNLEFLTERKSDFFPTF